MSFDAILTQGLFKVLNNLGCLSYMFGRIEMAISYLEESLDLQGRIAEQSLYIGSRFSCHNGTLNATITKGNLGLLALATGDPSMSITAFEASLRVSKRTVWIASCHSTFSNVSETAVHAVRTGPTTLAA
jgi:hypothetical protein